MVEVKKLNFKYDKDEVINDVTFSVKKGEVYTVLGVSGSGKSTLLRLIANLNLSTDNNSITIDGISTNEYREKGKLSFMFQNAALMPNLTVRENIEFPLVLLKKKIIKSEIDEIINLVGLLKYQDYLPHKLSGGMRTRVSLARAVVTKPELLLLDEPFSALDISWKFNLYGYISEIQKEYNTTIIMVTHDIQEAILLADKVFVLSAQGRKIKEYSILKNCSLEYNHKVINNHLKKMQKTFFDLQTDIISDSMNNNKIQL